MGRALQSGVIRIRNRQSPIRNSPPMSSLPSPPSPSSPARLRRAGGVEPGQGRSSSARSAAPSRRTSSTARPGRSRNSTSSKRCASCRRPARLAGREAKRAVPELQGGDGLRPDARRPELRVLRLAGAGGLRGDQAARSARRACCRSRSRGAGARADPPLVREQVARAGQAASDGAGRHGARRVPAVLDVRRARRLPVARRGRALLLHDRDVPRQPGTHPDAAGAARAVGARLGAR